MDSFVTMASPAGEAYQPTPLSIKDVVSWRQLQLSRAKLKAASRTSALMSGFAIVAMVELEVSGRAVPDWLLVAFACSAALLIAVHMLALMLSTCILPNLATVTPLDARSLHESPHEKMRLFIEISWIFSTGLGILLFLVVVVLLIWVKFLAVSRGAAIGATLITCPVLVLFVAFALVFYRKLTMHKFQQASQQVQRLQRDLQAFAGESDSLGEGVKVV